MSNKPEFKQKANELLLGLEKSSCPMEQLDKIEHTLEQMWSAGYRYAVVNDWWQTQETDNKKHTLKDI